MRRLLYFTLSLIMITSCTLDSSDNGALDGYWQLSSIDTLANGHSVNMRDSGIFWAVQKDLLVARATKEPLLEVIFIFKHTSDSLILSKPHLAFRDSSDIIVTDASVLYRLGVTDLQEHYAVSELSSSRMVLRNNDLQLLFRKY